MTLRVRRTLTVIDHQLAQPGRDAAAIPLRKVAAVAIVENPCAGRDVADLQSLVTGSVALGESLAALAVDALKPFHAQSYGKGALIGLAGEQEHGNALITTAFANPVRAALGGGKAWISSFTKRVAPGTTIDIPLASKDALYVRSHYDGMTLMLPDAPLADEIAVILCLANRGRLAARVGGLSYEDIAGTDGLR